MARLTPKMIGDLRQIAGGAKFHAGTNSFGHLLRRGLVSVTRDERGCEYYVLTEAGREAASLTLSPAPRS